MLGETLAAIAKSYGVDLSMISLLTDGPCATGLFGEALEKLTQRKK